MPPPTLVNGRRQPPMTMLSCPHLLFPRLALEDSVRDSTERTGTHSIRITPRCELILNLILRGTAVDDRHYSASITATL